MDGSSFDALTRLVAARPSRRRLLRALAGGLLLPLSGQAVAAESSCADELRACLAQAGDDFTAARRACQQQPRSEQASCLATASATQQAAANACQAAFTSCQSRPVPCQPTGGTCFASADCCAGLVCAIDGTCQQSGGPACVTAGSYNSATQQPSLANLDLRYCDLVYANLGGADLSGADLTDADLTDANLHGADLSGANLSYASLYDAVLTFADLTHADLRGADLRLADLSGVIWSDTTCPDGTNSDDNGNTCLDHLAP